MLFKLKLNVISIDTLCFCFIGQW